MLGREWVTKASNQASSLWYSISQGRMTNRRLGAPLLAAVISASFLNRSVAKVTVGTPRRSSSTASWTLHAVQDPQLHNPFRTASVLLKSANALASVGSPVMPVRITTS